VEGVKCEVAEREMAEREGGCRDEGQGVGAA
jgi:hypothetical protein